MKQMLLAITVYNCEGRIIKTLNSLDDSVMKYMEEILIVDTDSTDRTKEEIRAYAKKHKDMPIRLLKSSRHSGQGSAIKTAFGYANKNNYRYLILLRGDGQTDIHNFLPVLAKEKYKEYDAILGARFMNGSRLHDYARIRIMGNIIMNLFYSIVCGRKILDMGAGINLYAVKILRQGYYQKFPENNLFLAMMLLAERKLKHNIIFYPIETKEDGVRFPMKILNQTMFLIEWGIRFLVGKNPVEGEYRRRC